VEDRFIRELEKKFFDGRRAELEREARERERQRIAPVLAGARELLSRSGDALSPAGLEAVARWKADG
jgi:hypothetical protein